MAAIANFFAAHGYNIVSLSRTDIQPFELLTEEDNDLSLLGSTVNDLFDEDMRMLPRIKKNIEIASFEGDFKEIVDIKTGFSLLKDILQRLGLGSVGADTQFSEDCSVKFSFKNPTLDGIEKLLELDAYISGAIPKMEQFKTYQEKLENSELYIVTHILKAKALSIEILNADKRKIDSKIELTGAVEAKANFNNNEAGTLKITCSGDDDFVFALKAVQIKYHKPNFFKFWNRKAAGFTIKSVSGKTVRGIEEEEFTYLKPPILPGTIASNLYDLKNRTQNLKHTVSEIELKDRIKDFNDDFRLTLLDGLRLYDACGQFRDEENDIYYSNAHLQPIFSHLKQVRNGYIENTEKVIGDYHYILIADGKLLGSDLADEDANNEKLLAAIKLFTVKYEYAKFKLLLTISSKDVSNDDIHDIFILSVFELKTDILSIQNDYFRNKMNRFLKYPMDYFNSPVVKNYFNKITEVIDFKNTAHNSYNVLTNINALLNNITNELEYISRNTYTNIVTYLDKIAHDLQNTPYSIGVGADIVCIKKELDATTTTKIIEKINRAKQQVLFIEIQLRILNNKEITHNDIGHKNIKGIMAYITEQFLMRDDIDFIEETSEYQADKDLVSDWKGNETNVFAVLFNLWINATKGSALLARSLQEGEKVPVTVSFRYNKNNDLCIGFENRCDLATSFDHVASLLNPDIKMEPTKGRGIIKHYMKELGWTFTPESKIDRENGLVFLEVCCTKKVKK